MTSQPPTSDQLTRYLLSDQAYELLRSRLLSQEYAPGSHLVESEIARQLSVSQAPVRDALKRLAHEGLVVQIPRRGSFVADVSISEAREAYQVRAAIEEYAAAGALEHVTPELIDELELRLADMHEAARLDDQAAFIDADVSFHRAVWSAAHNSFLPRVWMLLEPAMRSLAAASYRRFFSEGAEIADTHRPLVEGLRARDPKVVQLFRDHALNVWHQLEE